MLSARTPRGDEQRCCGCNTDFIRISMHWSHNPQCQHSHDSIVAYQQSHSLVGVLDNDLSSEEDYEEVRDPPENEGTVARHRCSHEANRNRVGALDNDLSTEVEDDEEEIIDLSDEVMEEQDIQGTRGQALTGARDPLVGIRILTSQANAGSGSGGSSDDEPMEDQGTFQHSTMLADGTVTSTLVSSRIMKSSNVISKRRKMELNQTDDFDPAPEDDLSVVTTPAELLEDGSRDSVNYGTDDGEFVTPHETADDDVESFMARMIPPGAPCADGDGDNNGSSGPPALGTCYCVPLEAALLMLPKLLPHESALVELLEVLRKPRNSLQTFDVVVKWLEEHLSKSTFKDTKKLPRQRTLMKRVSSTYKVPKHSLHTVPLETGTANGRPDEYVQGKYVKVPIWDFVDVLKHYLLEPTIFGHVDNLVNKPNPFGKCVVDNLKDTKEYLASRHYSESYDKLISNPLLQFLLPLEFYVDKTGKTSGPTSSCGEPFIFMTALLTQAARELPSAWRCLGLLPDLEKSSSAKKMQEVGRKYEKGRNLQNYHRCLAVIVKAMESVMRNGGVDMYVRMGDEIKYLKVIPCVTFIIGDGKSGDTLVLRFGGKNCVGRVSRLCMTPFRSLSDPMRCCPLIRGICLEQLFVQSVDDTKGNIERSKLREALASMSTHLGENPLLRLEYGANPYGLTLATPHDCMHMNESGLFKDFIKVFVGSMTLSVRVKVDAIVERLFVGNRQTIKESFSRTNFKGGATSLTLLSSHHWPGMALSFLMMLLSEEGKDACKKCFAEEDAPEPPYDWDDAPSVNLSCTYVPPILRESSNSFDANGDKPPKLNSDEDSDEGDGDDGWQYHDLDVDNDQRARGEEADDEYDSSSDDDNETGHNKDGKKIAKKACPLKCSYRQFVSLLQELLAFHSWWRYGPPPFDHSPTQEEVDAVQLRIRKMIARIITFCPRLTGYGWDLQKLHDHLHIVICLIFFHHSMNYDAGRGERLLKYFFKELASTCQQRSGDEFIEQVAKRMEDRQSLTKAIDSLNPGSVYEGILERRREEQEAANRKVSHSFGVLSGYSLERGDPQTPCSFTWNGSNQSVQIHPVVLRWVAENWNEQTLGETYNHQILNCFTEYIHEGAGYRRLYRASPNYAGGGSWYDWAMVRFDGDHGDYPSRLLLFYRKHEPTHNADGTDDSSGIYAIIQTCAERGMTQCERREAMEETHLCSRWEIESRVLPGGSDNRRRPNVPILRSAPVEAIQDHVYVVEEKRDLCESWHGHRYIWTVEDQRSIWHSKFSLFSVQSHNE